jgi:diketogulonate reductase-like aldo/keto reductase
LKGRLLELALEQALTEMIHAGYAVPLVDTAVMYQNDAQILKCIAKFPNMMVGSKIKRSGEFLKSELKVLVDTFGDRLHRVLLHRQMSPDNFHHLLEAKRAGLVKEVGVSNYTVAQLQELLDNCNGKPDVVQNEFHPFLRSSVPEFCKKHGIKFEAHSVMTGKENYLPFAAEWGISPGQIAMAYAFQVGGGGACFSSSNYKHLAEDLDVQILSPAQISALSQLVETVQHVRYKGADGLTWTAGLHTVELDAMTDADLDALCSQILPRLLQDVRALHEGGRPSALARTIPERPVANRLMTRLAGLVFNNARPPADAAAADPRVDDLSRVHRLSHLLKRIRKRAEAADAAAKAAAGNGLTCKAAAALIADPAALPVAIPDAAPFAHVIGALAELRAPPAAPLRFEKGTLFPDGRMDMCKQVAQLALERCVCDGCVRRPLFSSPFLCMQRPYRPLCPRPSTFQRFQIPIHHYLFSIHPFRFPGPCFLSAVRHLRAGGAAGVRGAVRGGALQRRRPPLPPGQQPGAGRGRAGGRGAAGSAHVAHRRRAAHRDVVRGSTHCRSVSSKRIGIVSPRYVITRNVIITCIIPIMSWRYVFLQCV